MSEYTPIRDRDAWATIRGYAFQVDKTIERWLSLDAPNVLELECGEDIDLVFRARAADSNEQKRILEQVKHLDKNVTLRSSGAVSALANAAEHSGTDALHRLTFQFTTNASPGIERPSSFSPQTGIQIWETLRKGKLKGLPKNQSIKGILDILRSSTRPEGIPDPTWNAYQGFLIAAAPRTFLSFIQRFEWITGSPDAYDIGTEIKARLLLNGHATNPVQAVAIYDRLFLSVLRLLCIPGRKQLSVEDRDSAIALQGLNATEFEELKSIKSSIDNLCDRVLVLEANQGQMQLALAQLDTRVTEIAFGGVPGGSLDLGESPLVVDLPPLIEQLSLRTQSVTTVMAHVQSHTWTALHGSYGEGKSILARLIAEKYPVNTIWLRMRDLTAIQSARVLDRACIQIAGEPLTANRDSSYLEVARELGEGALVVLDDLCQLAASDPMGVRLEHITRVFSNQNITMLSTSNHPLPSALTSDNQKLIAECPVPQLDDQEAREVLQAHGAPSALLNSNFVAMVNRHTFRHPQLLVAFAKYMQQQDWSWSVQKVGVLLRSSYAERLNDETISRLLTSVEDADSRELLYRLNVEYSNLNLDKIQLLATINPVVTRPRERLRDVSGLWVQRDTDDLFIVSPLIKSLGHTELRHQTLIDCHVALGDYVMKKVKVNDFDLGTAVSHFALGESYDRAGTVLGWALSQLSLSVEDRNRSSFNDRAGLLAYWWDTDLPRSMRRFIAIYLRTQQISLAEKIGRNFIHLLPSLEELIDGAGSEDDAAICAAAGLAAYAIAKHNFPLACKVVSKAVVLLPGLTLPNGEAVERYEDIPLENLIWIPTISMSTCRDISDWANVIEVMTPEQRGRVLEEGIVELSCVTITERLWRLELDKASIDRNWTPILGALENFSKRMCAVGAELFWAAAVRSQVIIYAEFLNDVDNAKPLAVKALSLPICGPKSKYLICEALGRELGYSGDVDSAMIWLSQALSNGGNTFPVTRVRTLVEAATFVDEPNLQSLSYLQEAVLLARNNNDFGELNLTEILCELAIGYWRVVDMKSAFDVWNEAAERLLDAKDDSDHWKGLSCTFGHVSGYFSSVTRRGLPPDFTDDGSEYAAPKQGMFLKYKPDLAAAAFTEERFVILPVVVAMFAEGVGDDDRAVNWALKATNIAENSNLSHLIVGTISQNIAPSLIAADKYEDAITILLDANATLVALNKVWGDGRDPFKGEFDRTAILGTRESVLWQQAEDITLKIAVIGSVIRLAILALDDYDGAPIRAQELAETCRVASEDAAMPDLWLAVADSIEHGFNQQTELNDLLLYENSENEVAKVSQVINLISATVRPDCRPEDALRAHLTSLHYVLQLYTSIPGMNRRIVVPFVTKYWSQTFKRVRFLFSSPRFIEDQLVVAKSAPPERRIQETLKTVANGLRISLPDWVNEWLNSP